MILNPAIIAQITGSLLVSIYGLYASVFGLRIVNHWDIESGSELQLSLERRTYLVSTVAAHLFVLSLFSTFLFIYTGEHLHPLFVGAMCTAGTLNVNAYGYPLLTLKIMNFFLCGLWLIVNYTDGMAPDYPLIKAKYRFLAVITALLVLETLFTLGYFRLLRADVITSCCGTLFSTESATIMGDMASMPARAAKALVLTGFVIYSRCGIHLSLTGRGGRLFGLFSAGLFVLSLLSVVAVVSVYYYELPTHHCPFCLLQGEYHYIGYLLYGALFLGGITGAGVGVIDRFRTIPSLGAKVPTIQKRLTLWSMIGFGAFLLISVYPMVFSDFRLEGY